MPAAADVKPQRWTAPEVLFDNGRYSVIRGIYEHDSGEKEPALGERWNGRHTALGFPNVSGHAVWHVVPEFLEVPILHGLLDELSKQPTQQNREYAGRVLDELGQALKRQRTEAQGGE